MSTRPPDPEDTTAGSDTVETPDDAGHGGGDVPDAERGRETLRAGLLPSLWGNRTDADVVIDIYVVTGRHGLLRVPESFCRECHVFTRRADVAAEQATADVDVRVHSWWTRFLGALRYGGYHPPVMVVGGKRLCQGHDVPTTDEVLAAIDDALTRKRD